MHRVLILATTVLTLGAPLAAQGKVTPATDSRAAWMDRQIERVVSGEPLERRLALDALLSDEHCDDAIARLEVVLGDHQRDHELVIAILRALGRDGLHAAAPILAPFLKHSSPALRGHAVVSLEYVASPDPRILKAIAAMAAREKDVALRNHAWRALGRSGRGHSGSRTRLLKAAERARSATEALGPFIGLAYFQGDQRAARGVEKIIKRLGLPNGRARGHRLLRRSDDTRDARRALSLWTLAHIRHAASASFVHDRLLDRLAHVREAWAAPHRSFWADVEKAIEGDATSMKKLVAHLRRFLAQLNPAGANPDPSLRDAYRSGRKSETFTPLGQDIAPARTTSRR